MKQILCALAVCLALTACWNISTVDMGSFVISMKAQIEAGRWENLAKTMYVQVKGKLQSVDPAKRAEAAAYIRLGLEAVCKDLVKKDKLQQEQMDKVLSAYDSAIQKIDNELDGE